MADPYDDYDNNRNFPGDTHEMFDVESEMPYVSPHEDHPRGIHLADDADFATGGQVIHPDGRVTTRYKGAGGSYGDGSDIVGA